MKISAKDAWLANPWVDTFFLTGFPIIFFVLAIGPIVRAGLFNVGASASSFPVIDYLRGMHVAGTWLIVYLNRDQLRKSFILYAWVPLFLVCLFFLFRLSGYRNQTSTVLFYSIIWHELFQYYFITRVFYLTRSRYSMADVVISSIALVSGPAYFFLRSLSYFQYEYFGQVWSLPVYPFLLAGLKFVMLSSMLLFIARQIYCYLKWKKIYWFAILMVLMSNCLYYLTLSFFKDKDFYFYSTFRVHHSLQYLGWIACFFFLKFKAKPSVSRPGLRAYLALPRRAFYFFGLLWLFTYLQGLGVIVANVTHHYLFNEYYSLVLILIHVYLDMIIWWNTVKIAREVL